MKKRQLTSLVLSVIMLFSASFSSCSNSKNEAQTQPEVTLTRSENICIKGYGITSEGDLKIVSSVAKDADSGKISVSVTSNTDSPEIIEKSTVLSKNDTETLYLSVYSDIGDDRQSLTEKLSVSPYVTRDDGSTVHGILSETSVYKAAVDGTYSDSDAVQTAENIIATSESAQLSFNGSTSEVAISGFDSVTYTESSEQYTFTSALTVTADSGTALPFNYYTLSYTSTQPVKGRVSYTKADGTDYTETFFLAASDDGEFSSYADFCSLDSAETAEDASVMTFENLGETECSVELTTVAFSEKSYPSSQTLRANGDVYGIGVDIYTGALTELSSATYTEYENYVSGSGISSKYYGSEEYKIDQCSDIGKLVDYSLRGNSVTTVTRPIVNGEYVDAYIITKAVIYNACVSYSTALTDFYDFGHEESETQYAPVVDIDSSFSKFNYYSGSSPWTTDTLTSADSLGAWGTADGFSYTYSDENTERWIASTDSNGVSVGVFCVDADGLVAGSSGSCNTLSFTRAELLPTYTAYTNLCLISIGTLDEIRSEFAIQKNYGETGKIIDANTGDSYVDYGTYYITNEGDTVTANNATLAGPTVAVDDLDRELPLATDTKLLRDDRYVGMFYFLWMGEHGDSGVFDITKILNTYSTDAYYDESVWGAKNEMHFFSEPLYGYYYSSDEWVMRKHIEELTNAGVDFLYLDVTNGFPYLDNARKLMQIIHEFNEQGWDAPQIVFYTNNSSSTVVTQVYNAFYATGFCEDAWFKMNGKPVIVATSATLSDEMNAFFEVREPQWPNEASQKTNAWPWISFFAWDEVYYNDEGEREAISVSVAQHCGSVNFARAAMFYEIKGEITYDRGRSYHNGNYDHDSQSYLYGYNFQERWDQAIAEDVPYVLVTSWNEWVAQRQAPAADQTIVFVDTFNIEYSRDVEMTRGYYFDNYYMQLISNIRAYKGTTPLLHQAMRSDTFMTDMYDYDRVQVMYSDFKGDTADRNNACFGNSTYTDTSGRNDIVASKVCFDSTNVYFYVECASNITDYVSDTSWMQLFINTDNSNTTGWYGFDYIINHSYNGDGTVNIAKFDGSNKKTYSFSTVSTAECVIDGKQMMITVPAQDIGVDVNNVEFSFKWADSDTNITTMEQFYTDGDSAPHGRLNFLFVD